MAVAQPGSPPRHMNLLLAAAGLLVLAGGGLFWQASQRAAGGEDQAIAVTVDGSACDPMQIEVPAGRASFRIVNASDRPLEWEILDGVMVVAERENIAPGFSSTLTERLRPGVYAITCGLMSNPRGTLTVLHTAESAAASTAPPLREFLGPLSEQRVQTLQLTGRLVRDARSLQDALLANDTEAARTAWMAAASDWAALGPLALLATDLRDRIAPQAEGLAGREADPAFIGLHRIEYGLFARQSTEGLLPVARGLVADAEALRDRGKTIAQTPEAIAANAARYAQVLADGQVSAGLAPYAADDRGLMDAALSAIAASYGLVAPLVRASDAAVADRIDQATVRAQDAIAATPFDRAATARAFGDLARSIGQVNAALGLEIGG